MAAKKGKKHIGKAIVIIGVIIIPLMYSFFYLQAFWDPYSRLDKVSVAVVNLDEGANINGKNRNIGDEICENLKEDGSLDFNFTDAEDAEDGVLNQKYYASITIPKDFSSNVSTIADDGEKLHSEIIYSANQKKNYLAAQILENAMPTIKQTVNSSIDKEIIDTLTTKLNSVPEQMGELQDGLGQLSDGAATLKNGTSQLDSGASTLKDGSKTLSDGANQVSDGSKMLSNGISSLKDGTSQLNSSVPTLAKGVKALNTGAKKLAVGADTLNSGLKTYTDGVASAADGSDTLNTGLKTYTNGVASAADGSDTLNTGLKTYTDGVASLYSGSQQLYTGIMTASDGIDEIESQVAASYKQLEASADDSTLSSLKSGASSVASGTSSLVSATKGVKQLVAAYNNASDEQTKAQYMAQITAVLNQVSNDDLEALESGSSQVSDGVSALTGAMSTVKTNTKALDDGLKTLQAGFGSVSTDGTLVNGAYRINAGLKQLDSSSDTLTNGMSQLNSGLTTLKANNTTLTNGMSQLNSVLTTLKSNNSALTSGSSQLASGSKELSDGTATLYSNVPALSSGVSKLDSGASQLLSGSKSFADGSKQVADGSVSLYNGVLSLKDGTKSLDSGAQELKDGIDTAKTGVDDSVEDANEQLKALDGLSDYAVEPVSTKTRYVQPVENYGSAFAPYFMGLSLWVGGLMIFFGIYLDYTKKIKSLTKDGKSFRKKCLSFGAISAVQGIALALVIKFALGITVNNFAMLIASCVLCSICFMVIIQFFIMYTGNAGKFISLLLLILQLTSSAGTFPIETQSEFFVVINKLLPMTYSTQLFKEAISGTAGSWAAKNAAVLAAFTVAFLALCGIARLVEKKKESKNAPSAQPLQA